MYLGSMNCSIYQAHPRDPLQFSPSAAAIAFAKTGQPTDGSTNGNRLNIPNRSDEFEIHRPRIKSSFHRNFHLTPNEAVEKPPRGGFRYLVHACSFF